MKKAYSETKELKKKVKNETRRKEKGTLLKCFQASQCFICKKMSAHTEGYDNLCLLSTHVKTPL